MSRRKETFNHFFDDWIIRLQSMKTNEFEKANKIGKLNKRGKINKAVRSKRYQMSPALKLCKRIFAVILIAAFILDMLPQVDFNLTEEITAEAATLDAVQIYDKMKQDLTSKGLIKNVTDSTDPVSLGKQYSYLEVGDNAYFDTSDLGYVNVVDTDAVTVIDDDERQALAGYKFKTLSWFTNNNNNITSKTPLGYKITLDEGVTEVPVIQGDTTISESAYTGSAIHKVANAGLDSLASDGLYYTIEYDNTLGGYYRQYYVSTADQLSTVLYYYDLNGGANNATGTYNFDMYLRAVPAETPDNSVGVCRLGIVLLNDLDLGGDIDRYYYILDATAFETSILAAELEAGYDNDKDYWTLDSSLGGSPNGTEATGYSYTDAEGEVYNYDSYTDAEGNTYYYFSVEASGESVLTYVLNDSGKEYYLNQALEAGYSDDYSYWEGTTNKPVNNDENTTSGISTEESSTEENNTEEANTEGNIIYYTYTDENDDVFYYYYDDEDHVYYILNTKELYNSIEYDETVNGYFMESTVSESSYYILNASELLKDKLEEVLSAGYGSDYADCWTISCSVADVGEKTDYQYTSGSMAYDYYTYDSDGNSYYYYSKETDYSDVTWQGYFNKNIYLDIDGNGYTVYNAYYGEKNASGSSSIYYCFIGRFVNTSWYADYYFYLHDLTFSNNFIGHRCGMFGYGVNYGYFDNVNWESCIAASESALSGSTAIVVGLSYKSIFFKDCTISDCYVAGAGHCATFASYDGGSSSIVLQNTDVTVYSYATTGKYSSTMNYNGYTYMSSSVSMSVSMVNSSGVSDYYTYIGDTSLKEFENLTSNFAGYKTLILYSSKYYATQAEIDGKSVTIDTTDTITSSNGTLYCGDYELVDLTDMVSATSTDDNYYVYVNRKNWYDGFTKEETTTTLLEPLGYYYYEIPKDGEYKIADYYTSGISKTGVRLSAIEAVEAAWSSRAESSVSPSQYRYVTREGTSGTWKLNYACMLNIYENCAALDSSVYDISNHSGVFVSCMQSGNVFKDCFSNSTIYVATQGGAFVGAAIGCGNGFFYPYDENGDGNTESTFVNVVFESCFASGSVEGSTRLGGFVGMIFDDDRAISRSSPNGTSTSYRGRCLFDNCYATSSVGMEYSGNFVGGFCGVIVGNICGDTTLDEHAEQHIFNNCCAAGEVGGITTITDTDSTVNSIGGFFGAYVNYLDEAKYEAFNCTYNLGTSYPMSKNETYASISRYACAIGAQYSMDGGVTTKTAPNNVVSMTNCYYDMQTTAMRERDVGCAIGIEYYPRNSNFSAYVLMIDGKASPSAVASVTSTTLDNNYRPALAGTLLQTTTDNAGTVTVVGDNLINGIYTEKSTIKGVKGLTDSSLADLGFDSSGAWTQIDEYYPILNAFYLHADDYEYAASDDTTRADEINNMKYERQQLYYYYALASVATVFLDHYDEILSDGTDEGVRISQRGNVIAGSEYTIPAGEIGYTQDTTIYDTVRSITRKFTFTSSVPNSENICWSSGDDVSKNAENGFYSKLCELADDNGHSFTLTWEGIANDGSDITQTYTPNVLTISEVNGVYKCLDFAPGKQWVGVMVSDAEEIYSGARYLRLLPMAYLNGGGIIKVNVGTSTMVYCFDATSANIAENETELQKVLAEGYTSEPTNNYSSCWSINDTIPSGGTTTEYTYSGDNSFYYTYEDESGHTIYYYTVTTSTNGNAITAYVLNSSGEYEPHILNSFTHYVGVAYAITDRYRMDMVYDNQYMSNWTGKSTTGYTADSTDFAVYSGYLQSGYSTDIGLDSDGNMYDQEYKVKYDNESSDLYNNSTEGSTIVKVYYAKENESTGELDRGDEVTDETLLEKFEGQDDFTTDDTGYYYMVYRWRLNNGRYLEDYKLVQITSDAYNVSIVTGIQNNKHTVTTDGITATTAIDQYVTDKVTVDDNGAINWVGAYPSTDSDFSEATAPDYYDSGEYEYNTVHTYNNENYYVKAKTITTGEQYAVVSWKRSSDYQLVTLIIEVQNSDGTWSELQAVQNGSLVGETTYEYIYKSTTAEQDPETKLYTITTTEGAKKNFKINAISSDADGSEEVIELDFTSSDSEGTGTDMSEQTPSFRITALFAKAEAEVVGEKTVLLNPAGTTDLSEDAVTDIGGDISEDADTNETDSSTSLYAIASSLSDYDEVYEVDDTDITDSEERKAVLAGDILTYRIKLKNTGYLDANDVTVTDYIPEGCTYVNDSMKIYIQKKENSATSSTSTYDYVYEIDGESGDSGYDMGYDSGTGMLTWRIPNIDYNTDYYVEFQATVDDIGASNTKYLLTNEAKWGYVAETESMSTNSNSGSTANRIANLAVYYDDKDEKTDSNGNEYVTRTYNVTYSLDAANSGMTGAEYEQYMLYYNLPDGFTMAENGLTVKNATDGSDVSYTPTTGGIIISGQDLTGEYTMTITGTQYLLGSSLTETEVGGTVGTGDSVIKDITIKLSAYYYIYDSEGGNTLVKYEKTSKLSELLTNEVETDVTHLYLNVEKTIEEEDASQSFLFRIEQYESETAYRAGNEPLGTWYTALQCTDEVTNTSGTVIGYKGNQIVQVENRGYYVVTEATDWSATDYDFDKVISDDVRSFTDAAGMETTINGEINISNPTASAGFDLPRQQYVLYDETGVENVQYAFPTAMGIPSEGIYPTISFSNTESLYAYLSGQSYSRNRINN